MGKTYEIKPVHGDEANLFYANAGKEAERGCIGYLRADFGGNGKEFWTTWNDQCKDLKTQAFKDELNEVIDHLRERGNMLDGYAGLSKFCFENRDAKLGAGHRDDSYGFRIDTDSHSYFLRGILARGDYNLYCFTYQRDKLEQYLAQSRQEQMPEPEQIPTLSMDGI